MVAPGSDKWLESEPGVLDTGKNTNSPLGELNNREFIPENLEVSDTVTCASAGV